MISTVEIMGMLILLIILGIVIWWFIVADKYKKYLAGSSYTRGAHLKGGGTVNLSCDEGKEICIYKATQICSNQTIDNFETDATDPIDNGLTNSKMYGQFNPSTTISRLDDMKTSCKGKTTCDYKFEPSDLDFPNGMTCDTENVQLISTYTCIPKGSDCQSIES